MRTYQHVNLSPVELYRKYVLEQKSTVEIGCKIGCSSGAVIYQLQKAGITRRTMRECGELQQQVSDAELDELIATGLSMTEVAQRCGISYTTVYERVKALGIKPERDLDWPLRRLGWRTEDVLVLCKTNSMAEVARRTGLSDKYIGNLMRRYDVTRKPQIHDFWLVESVELAYALGLMYADGYLDDNVVSLTQKNPELIAKIADLVGLAMPSMGTTNRGFTYYTLRFGSRDLATHLAGYWGLTHGKTTRVHMPMNIAPNHVRDFIRGYFDGDGSVYELHRKGRGWRREVTFTSCSKGFLESLGDALHSLGLLLHHPTAVTNSHAWRLRYGGKTTQLSAFHQALYYPDCFCWSVKRDKLERILGQ